MAKKINNLYQCEICKLSYNDLIWAEKCQAWCKKYNACNLEITKHSIERQTGERQTGGISTTKIDALDLLNAPDAPKKPIK